MLKIGDFSALTQVSVKTLRYYDETGLLRPVHVDPSSGYRYYSVRIPRDADQRSELMSITVPK